jgi:hypothetical protein
VIRPQCRALKNPGERIGDNALIEILGMGGRVCRARSLLSLCEVLSPWFQHGKLATLADEDAPEQTGWQQPVVSRRVQFLPLAP